jgi:hypothetical protein
MTTLQPDHPAGPRRGPVRDGDDASVARDYFAGLAADYQAAFGGHARNPLDRVINRLFWRRTFALRSALVLETLAARPFAGKTMLDAGCGSGDLTVRVVPRMEARSPRRAGSRRESDGASRAPRRQVKGKRGSGPPARLDAPVGAGRAAALRRSRRGMSANVSGSMKTGTRARA